MPHANVTQVERNAGLRVLVVDDDHDITESWAILLRAVGYEVTTARDGIDALEKAVPFLPDVVMLDLSMPRRDGFCTAAMLIATLPARPLLVAISARDQPEDIERCKEIGFDHYFIKPARPEEILDLLSEWSRSRQGVRTILVLEHDAATREQLGTLLTQHGYRVALADTGQDALNYLQAHDPPDLIILDTLIQNVDACEFLRRLRTQWASIPFLITTAFPIASDEWAASLSAAGWLTKPFDHAMLLERVKVCMISHGR